MKNKIDWNLKFFREIFGIENLHFGFWQEDESVNIENFKKAQERYIDVLISKIPQNVKTILDVGCGTGEIAKVLIKKNYLVECISPDLYQYEIFKQKSINVKFYLTKFENFKTQKFYDLILMAESCQYLDLDKAFFNAKNILVKNGYLLISDYFRKFDIKYYRTLHTKDNFLKFLKKYNFEIIYEEDITSNVLKTLTLARKIYETYTIPIIKILSGYFEDKYFVLSKILNFLFTPFLKKIKYYIFEHTKNKLDEKKFCDFVEYKIYLLKKF